MTRRNGSRQLGALRRLPERTFDVLAAVLFSEDYGVSRGVLIPHELVTERAKRVEHTNSWKFLLEDAVWDDPRARDVTSELRSAAASL